MRTVFVDGLLETLNSSGNITGPIASASIGVSYQSWSGATGTIGSFTTDASGLWSGQGLIPQGAEYNVIGSYVGDTLNDPATGFYSGLIVTNQTRLPITAVSLK